MNITVRLGAGVTSDNSAKRQTVSLDDPATIGNLITTLQQLYPKIINAVAVTNGFHASADMDLQDGQEVSFLLPIAGG